jgi:hypothetical protein
MNKVIRWCQPCQRSQPHKLRVVNGTTTWQCVPCYEDEIDVIKRLSSLDNKSDHGENP